MDNRTILDSKRDFIDIGAYTALCVDEKDLNKFSHWAFDKPFYDMLNLKYKDLVDIWNKRNYHRFKILKEDSKVKTCMKILSVWRGYNVE